MGMRIFYNTSDDPASTVAEVLSADVVIDYKDIWDEDAIPEELKDAEPTCGVIFTMASVESLPEGECYYDMVYYFGRELADCYSIIRKLFNEGKLDLQKYNGIILLNPSSDEILSACCNLRSTLL